MAKTLNQFLEGYLKVKNPDEQKFVDKHVVVKHPDRNGNGDEVFKGSKVKPIDRRKERHGYNPGEDEKVYEELKGNQHKIDANKNGKVDAHDFKLLRKKKKVAEEAEQIDELRLHFNADDADNRANAKKMVAHLKKRGIDAEHEGGSMYRATVKVHSKDPAHRAYVKNKVKDRYDVHINEEVEELEELSTATLQSYRKKARAQGNAIVDKMKMGGGDWSKDQKDTKTLRKRAAGAQASGKQLVKRGESLKTEEAEALDETAKIVAHLQKRYGDNIRKSHVRSAASDFGVDASKLAKAVRTKLGKNMLDEEQIDELSKKTLGSYVKKASGAEQPKNVMSPKNVPLTKIAAYQGDSETGYFGKRFNQATYDKAERLRKNRETGIKRAADKLTKEEVESIEEKLDMKKASMGDVITDFKDSNAPQFKGKSQDKRRAMAIAAKLTAERGGKPLRKEEKLADLLGDLTETHRRTMLSVFDKLNESNQKKFLEACETPEGVDSMLDFAISHRGE